MRWLRLALGAFIGVQSLLHTDWLAACIAAVLLFQAATNSGCGPAGCIVSQKSENK
jgi:hypothetical protein